MFESRPARVLVFPCGSGRTDRSTIVVATLRDGAVFAHNVPSAAAAAAPGADRRGPKLGASSKANQIMQATAAVPLLGAGPGYVAVASHTTPVGEILVVVRHHHLPAHHAGAVALTTCVAIARPDTGVVVIGTPAERALCTVDSGPFHSWATPSGLRFSSWAGGEAQIDWD
jgi:hypothetical protein